MEAGSPSGLECKTPIGKKFSLAENTDR